MVHSICKSDDSVVHSSPTSPVVLHIKSRGMKPIAVDVVHLLLLSHTTLENDSMKHSYALLIVKVACHVDVLITSGSIVSFQPSVQD